MIQKGNYNFKNDGSELWLDTPEPERNFENMLFNKSYFTLIDQCARGRGTHMTKDGFLNHIIAKNRIVYVRDDDTGKYFSVNWFPTFTYFTSYKCGAGINYQVFENITNKLKITWRIYVPAGHDPIEIWDVRVENMDKTARNISLFANVEMEGDGTDTYCNFLFRSAKYHPDVNAIIMKQDAEFHHYNDFPYHNGFFTAKQIPNSWDADKEDFIGTRNAIANPVGVEKGCCANSFATLLMPMPTMHFRFKINSGKRDDLRILVGACSDKSMVQGLRSKYLDGNIDKDSNFDAMIDDHSQRMDKLSISVPEKSMNLMLNKWVKHQVHYGAVWCRWGMKGYRDIVQNSQNVVIEDSSQARENILKACNHQYNDGFALRGWHPLDKMRYVDSAQWLISAITEYVKETGDFKFIDEVVPYMDEGEDTIYNHMMRALIRLYTDRSKAGLCLIFFGDWNDSLTGVCRKGKGVSVWMSMAFCRSVLLMKELAKYLGKSEDEIKLGRWHAEVSDAINKHGWDGKWYLCAIDDDGKLIGSEKNEEGKIFLNMQSWAQLGRVVTDERWKIIFENVEKHLDSGWGYILNWPTYTKPTPNVGRLSYLQPGICENGSVYTHGNAFLMLALLERGMADNALKLWKNINPCNPARPISCQTNIFINGYWGPGHLKKPGYAELPWYTGSAGWMYYGVIEYMLGLRRGYDGMTICPCMPSEWESVFVSRIYRGTKYNVNIKNPNKLQASPVQTILINGKEHPKDDPLPVDGRTYDVEVILE
ncbi:MAG: hypothetical protein ABFD79_11740 [Phycisphaerales bacterium]